MCISQGTRTAYGLVLGTLGAMLVCHLAATGETGQCLSVSSRAVQTTSGPRAEVGPAPSPDGRWLAFEYNHSGSQIIPQIWILDRAKGWESARPIVDNGNYNSWPSWSPDSQWISFMSGRKAATSNFLTDQIYKVRVKGGTVVQLTHFPDDTALRDSTSWSRDGRIAFVHGDSIYAINDFGGQPKELVNLQQTLAPDTLWGAVWSPDSTRLTFRGSPPRSEEPDQRIWVADLNSHHVSQVTGGPMDDLPSWMDNDHILFERGSKSGEVRIAVVCLRTLGISYLTRNHIDQTPAADPAGSVLFFARADFSEKNIHGWLPETHIWQVPMFVRKTK